MFIKNLTSLGLDDAKVHAFAQKLSEAYVLREKSFTLPKRPDDSARYRLTFLEAAKGDVTVAQALSLSEGECRALCARFNLPFGV